MRKCLCYRIGMIGIIVDIIVLFMNFIYDFIVLSEINWIKVIYVYIVDMYVEIYCYDNVV